MRLRSVVWCAGACALALTAAASCRDQGPELPASRAAEPGLAFHEALQSNGLPFSPLAASAACVAGGTAEQVILPAGFAPVTIAVESPEVPDLWDMNTVNETGREQGRFLYRTHEIGANGGVSVTDLETGVTQALARRADWERFDGRSGCHRLRAP